MTVVTVRIEEGGKVDRTAFLNRSFWTRLENSNVIHSEWVFLIDKL